MLLDPCSSMHPLAAIHRKLFFSSPIIPSHHSTTYFCNVYNKSILLLVYHTFVVRSRALMESLLLIKNRNCLSFPIWTKFGLQFRFYISHLLNPTSSPTLSRKHSTNLTWNSVMRYFPKSREALLLSFDSSLQPCWWMS